MRGVVALEICRIVCSSYSQNRVLLILYMSLYYQYIR
jgi:hypothetical protein